MAEHRTEKSLQQPRVCWIIRKSWTCKYPRKSSSLFFWLWVNRPCKVVMHTCTGLFLSCVSPGREVARLLFVTWCDMYQFIHQEFILKAKLTSFWTDLKPILGCFLLGDRELWSNNTPYITQPPWGTSRCYFNHFSPLLFSKSVISLIYSLDICDSFFFMQNCTLLLLMFLLTSFFSFFTLTRGHAYWF